MAEGLGLSIDLVSTLRLAAPLHDVGKVAMPDGILLKPGPLTPDEFERIKTHTITGARLLSGSRCDVTKVAEEVALNHHERWDGTGYPNGLREVEIPISGRIVSVADVFDALTHERPYKSAWSVADAVVEIESQAAHQFDPDVVEAFLDVRSSFSHA
jgi:putative two-component system response regulator